MHASSFIVAAGTLLVLGAASLLLRSGLERRAGRRAPARPAALRESAAYLSLREVGKELRDLWSAARALGYDEPVGSLAILNAIASERHFVGYRRLFESSTRESFAAMQRETVLLAGSSARRESGTEMTPHLAAALEVALEIAHRRGTPATSADVLDGLAVVTGSLAHHVLSRFRYAACEDAHQAWHLLERGQSLLWRERHESALERCETRSAQLAAEVWKESEAAALRASARPPPG